MLALHVEVDGKKFVLAGVQDWSLLALHLVADRRDPGAPAKSARTDSLELAVRGFTQKNSDDEAFHLRWPGKELDIGTKIVVTLVETDNPDPPIKRYRSDAKRQESPFTEEELREMRLQTYLELKKEFESGANG